MQRGFVCAVVYIVVLCVWWCWGGGGTEAAARSLQGLCDAGGIRVHGNNKKCKQGTRQWPDPVVYVIYGLLLTAVCHVFAVDGEADGATYMQGRRAEQGRSTHCQDW